MSEQTGDSGQQQAPVQVTMGERGLAPRDMSELWRFSQMIASSDLAPKNYVGKPANCAVAIEMGMELGLRPMQALQNIAVVNGRPSIYGDAALALVKTSGLCQRHREQFEGQPYNDDFRAVVTTQRVGEEPHVEEFSVADAKRAKLWGKTGPWTEYPRRMLQMRARSYALRNVYPDVLLGTLTSEEAGDWIETTATPVDQAPAAESGPAQPPAPAATKADALRERIAARRAPAGEMPGGDMPGGEAQEAQPAPAEAKPEAAAQPQRQAAPKPTPRPVTQRAEPKADDSDIAEMFPD